MIDLLLAIEQWKTGRTYYRINPLSRTQSTINKLEIRSEEGSIWSINKLFN